MKFAAAMAFFGTFMVWLGAGIVLTMHGNPWLLLAGLAVYGVAFARYGCLAH
jgi:hypothetical protein